MKIRCDVCDKEEASVFCTADEASLCGGCDHKVHHANKLASKHLRFSLLYPSSSKNSSPLCDICQDKKALLFCQQDRAILCKDCDSSIHSANEHKKKHDRFLLTGVKLSATSSVYKPSSESSSPSSSSSQDCSVPGSSISLSAPPQNNNNNKIQISSKINTCGDAQVNQWGSTSTISEYLIDTLPGWHVEDFLDSSLPPFGFSKSGGDDDGVLPYMEAEDDSTTKVTKNNNNTVSLPCKNVGIWVPQIPQTLPSYPNHYFSQSNNIQFGMYNKETSPVVQSYAQLQNMKQQGQNNNKRWYDDGGFTVPQIPTTTFTHPSTLPCNKKSRSFW